MIRVKVSVKTTGQLVSEQQFESYADAIAYIRGLNVLYIAELV